MRSNFDPELVECGCGDELCGGPENGFRHQCGGPKEACMVPGCRECGMPTVDRHGLVCAMCDAAVALAEARANRKAAITIVRALEAYCSAGEDYGNAVLVARKGGGK